MAGWRPVAAKCVAEGRAIPERRQWRRRYLLWNGEPSLPRLAAAAASLKKLIVSGLMSIPAAPTNRKRFVDTHPEASSPLFDVYMT